MLDMLDPLSIDFDVDVVGVTLWYAMMSAASPGSKQPSNWALRSLCEPTKSHAIFMTLSRRSRWSSDSSSAASFAHSSSSSSLLIGMMFLQLMCDQMSVFEFLQHTGGVGMAEF